MSDLSSREARTAAKIRVAVCPDFREEGWPSMDRVADSLVEYLARDHAAALEVTLLAPPFRRRAGRLSSHRTARNIDRGINRLWDYPAYLRRMAGRFDVFHIVDHSYSQLVRSLPASRTVVTCHDLDTFRSILDPAREPRGAAFNAMTRHILGGFARAACITCDTAVVRDELARRNLAPGARLLVAPVGVSADFSAAPDAEADARAARLVDAPAGAVEILHVGSTVPRKRVDTLLRAFAGLARSVPEAHLVRAGGPFTLTQERLIGELGIANRIAVLPPLDDRTLAAVYRRAAVVLLPSEREGFGLPVVEAMACGTPVVASDLPVLREVGGGVALHAAVGDVDAWTSAAAALLRERAAGGDAARDRRDSGIRRAARFTWQSFAATMAAVYADLGRPDAERAAGDSAACPA